MTSRQRVEKIFRNEIPDRPALGFFAIDSDTAAKVLGRETYWRAKGKSKIALWQGRRDEVVQSWIEDGIELYKKLDIIDVVPVCCEAAGLVPPRDYEPNPPKQVDDNTWVDEKGKVYKYSPVTRDITIVKDESVRPGGIDLNDEIWNGEIVPPDESIFEVVDALLAEFGEDRFVLGPGAPECAWYLPGNMEAGMMELAVRPDEVKHAYKSKVAYANAHDKFFVRDKQAGVLWGTDIAGQKGPLISPLMYKDVFLGGFKQRIASVKSLGQRVIKHMCGNNWLLLDIMIEAGIDCYQSVQESAGMDIIKLHRDYRDKFVLWGGVRLENLINGSMEDVRKDVKRVMTELAPQGRFILGTSHSVAVGTKYDNFMAMLDEYQKAIKA